MKQLDYALVGNCQISALLDPHARYVWCCMPRFDSEAIFSTLLGGKGEEATAAGSWAILPDNGVKFETRQRYVRNTNVVVTEFHLKNGDRYDIFDFAPRFAQLDGYYRAPQLMRIVRPVKGNPRVRVIFNPRFDYGRYEPMVSIAPEGIVYRSHSTRLFLHTDVPYTYVLNSQSFELSGDRYFVASHGEPFMQPLKFTCEEFLERTISYWRTWVKHCNIPFEYQDEVIRSALALKLHIYEDTGAIIAATTTSVPEGPTGGRCWDYRYCWLRDAYFVIGVLNQLGQFDEMEHFIQFLHNIAVTEPGVELQPVYGIGGERELLERELDWLDGFSGIKPVRVGNHAYTHYQYDVYGEMVLAVTPLFFDKRLDRIDISRAFENVTRLVEQAIAVFDKPDSGIWEFRSEQRHYVFSKLMSWVAVDRGIKIAEQLGHDQLCKRWIPVREKMRAKLEKEGWNDKLGMYVQVYNGVEADASNLLMATVNFHAPEDEKFKRTLAEYEKRLVRGGYTFRYRNEDDFGTPQHAFTICSFWMVDALAAVGRIDEARKMFESILAKANHVGLLSEDINPATSELWGNFPQTYSHVGLINSAFKLSRQWKEAF